MYFCVNFDFTDSERMHLVYAQTAGIDNTFRKKFDREEYLQRARDREAKVWRIFFYFFTCVLLYLDFSFIWLIICLLPCCRKKLGTNQNV